MFLWTVGKVTLSTFQELWAKTQSCAFCDVTKGADNSAALFLCPFLDMWKVQQTICFSRRLIGIDLWRVFFFPPPNS